MRQLLCIAWVCLAGLAPWTLRADPQLTDPLRTFANCAGRLSALMEHQWMFDGPGSVQTAARRAAVLDLIEATMTSGQERQVLDWRISAKVAHAALLTRATFNEGPEDALWARQMADRLIGECTAFLTS